MKQWPDGFVYMVPEAQQDEVAWNNWGLPVNMGPDENYCEQSKVNPRWWRDPRDPGSWTCIHAAMPGKCGEVALNFHGAVVGDGSCGLGPDDPLIDYTDDDLAEAVSRLRSMAIELESR